MTGHDITAPSARVWPSSHGRCAWFGVRSWVNEPPFSCSNSCSVRDLCHGLRNSIKVKILQRLQPSWHAFLPWLGVPSQITARSPVPWVVSGKQSAW